VTLGLTLPNTALFQIRSIIASGVTILVRLVSVGWRACGRRRALGQPAWAWLAFAGLARGQPGAAARRAAAAAAAAGALAAGLGGARYAAARRPLADPHAVAHYNGSRGAILDGVIVADPHSSDGETALRVRAEQLIAAGATDPIACRTWCW